MTSPLPDTRALVERTVPCPAHITHCSEDQRHHHLDSRLSRQGSTTPGISTPGISMAGSVHLRPAKDQAPTLMGEVSLVILLCLLGPSYASLRGESPHQPQRLTWQVLSQTGDVVWSTSHTVPPWTWWPQLFPDLCELAAGIDTWDIAEIDPRERVPSCQSGKCPCLSSGGIGSQKFGCSHPQLRARLRRQELYACP